MSHPEFDPSKCYGDYIMQNEHLDAGDPVFMEAFREIVESAADYIPPSHIGLVRFWFDRAWIYPTGHSDGGPVVLTDDIPSDDRMPVTRFMWKYVP